MSHASRPDFVGIGAQAAPGGVVISLKTDPEMPGVYQSVLTPGEI
jgi:hypothetical protein